MRAVEAAGAGLWEWDLAKNLIHVSSNLAEMLGLPSTAATISAGDFFDSIHADDIPLFRVALGEVLQDERPFVHEFRVEPEGEAVSRWLSFQGRALERDGDGEALVLAGLCLDVTDRREAEEAYELLNRELSHRMKNLLSIVGSLVNMTGEHRPEAREFVSSFQARLNTFAAAHQLLMRAEWQPVPVEDLVEKALSPIGVWNRVDLSAKAIMLGSQDAQTVVLVLHELATNAIKYGALSQGAGRVELSFKSCPPSEKAGPTLVMVWKEHGGPPVTPPARRGFGIGLIERLTKRQVSGEAVLDWRPEGLHCCIEIPVTPVRR